MFAWCKKHIAHRILALLLLLSIGGGVLAPAYASAQSLQRDTLSDFSSVNGAAIQGNSAAGEDTWYTKIMKWVLLPFLWVGRFLAGILMVIAGNLLALAIDLSLRIDFNNVRGVVIGWEQMRNFANLFFIFAILYIAIMTILQLGNHNTRQMLVTVIIVALLINFSMFITEVVIDAGNIVAVGFYNEIMSAPVSSGTVNCVPAVGGGAPDPCTLDERIMDALGVSMISGPVPGEGDVGVVIRFFFSIILYLVVAVVFFKGAFFFIVRTIAFAFLIMFSPLAFLAYAFPGMKGYATKWWGALTGYTALAPAFMIVIYLVFQVINAGGLTSATTPSEQILSFLVIIGLLWGGTSQAFKFADGVGSTVAGVGAKLVGGAAAGALAYGGARAFQGTLGRMGKNAAENESLNQRAAMGGLKGSWARMNLGLANKMATSSFDITQNKIVGAGMGTLGLKTPDALKNRFDTTGGFAAKGGLGREAIKTLSFGGISRVGTVGEAEQKAAYEEAKKRFPKNPAAQEAYLKSALGTSTYEGMKDTKTEIGTAKTKKESEKILEQKTGEAQKLEKELMQARTENRSADVEKLQKQLTEVTESVGKAMKNLGSNLVAGLSPSQLATGAVAANLTKGDINTIHKNASEGKYSDPQLMNTIAQNVMMSGNTKAQKYLKSKDAQDKLLLMELPEMTPINPEMLGKRAEVKTRMDDTQKNIASMKESIEGIDQEFGSDTLGLNKAKAERSTKLAELERAHEGLKAEYSDISSRLTSA